ncbi:ABC-ATPase domain-containing protein [Alkalicoccus daliensis]|uniref:Predicted ATPase of the ABC class n=1 Tax=Alkalicoccus daliensis TaxID=745820 RepID=A0A1H0ANY7_9BACI|nr:ABC-ATPase domain-containing protein [Alkalicoccus daliensis]SDN35099.1 Predicted ATPase of the ABC class [Alkalicoccus daliensis]
MIKSLSNLKDKLLELDKKSYNTLKSVQGTYLNASNTEVHLDYIQGDPFASPSRLRIRIPLTNTQITGEMFSSPSRKIALKHFFTKEFDNVRKQKQSYISGTGKSGMIMIDTPGQEVIDRSSVEISSSYLEFRISCGIPAKGRKVMGKAAADLLCKTIPLIAEETALSFDKEKLTNALILADDQQIIREELNRLDKIAFIGNGAVLPRKSGESSLPLSHSSVVPFETPEEFKHSITLSNGKKITGMLINKGVTLIIGGGYHGKSTLLQAIERGVYNHEPYDGREFVITEDSAVKIRAEDRRSVRDVNISPFINELPNNKSTERFNSADASGSTSQAANIMEALEAGSSTLLIDEDTSATNFMIRDARMQKLVRKNKEPITPFVDRVRDLFEEQKTSTILVLGGSGDYFEAADAVIMMDEYKPVDKTAEAKELVKSYVSHRDKEYGARFPAFHERQFPFKDIKAKLDKKENIQGRGMSEISIGRSSLQLDAVEQIVSPSQTEAIAMMIKKLWKENGTSKDLVQACEDLYSKVQNDNLDVISPFSGKHPGNIALPRKQELIAAINRIRQ